MNTKDVNDVRSTWNKQKAILKEKFKFLTDGDLKYEDGHIEAMLKNLQTKLGKTKPELTKILAEL